MAAAPLAAYDVRLIPADALVRRTDKKNQLVFALLVRRAAGESPYEAPAQLQVRLTCGEDVFTVPLRLQNIPGEGPAPLDSRYQEFPYAGDLPDALRGPTLVEWRPPGSQTTVRTLVSVIQEERHDLLSSVAAGPRSETLPGKESSGQAEPVSPLARDGNIERAARDATRVFVVPGVTPNEPVYFTLNLTRGIHRLDARFQLSFRYRFISKITDWNGFGAAITTTSLWDLHSFSVPFRDSTYRPSLLWMFEEHPLGPRWKFSADVGLFEHESNGRGPDPDRPVGDGNTDSLSRSMNRAFVRPTFTVPTDWGIFSVSPKFFVPFLVSSNNRDVAHYRGNSELLLKWKSKESRGHVFSFFLRQGTDSSKHFVQADYGMPLRLIASKNINGWLLFQWLYGYGETLRDYNVRNPGTLRTGIMVVP